MTESQNDLVEDFSLDLSHNNINVAFSVSFVIPAASQGSNRLVAKMNVVNWFDLRLEDIKSCGGC